jgi:iron complex outermembrane receptor protein
MAGARRVHKWGVAGLIALACARAHAQVQLGTVEVEAPRAAADAPRPDPDAVPFVTVVDARAPTARVASVADLLERQAGVQVRSRGGLGAFTSVSMRGSDANEVAVFLDGVPLSRAAAGTLDLSLYPADGLDHIEIYRGVPPVELGAEGVGGAINLVSRRGAGRPAWRASVGGGSFGARAATVGWGGETRGLRVDASAAYRGATGDFSYYDAGGTLLDTSDDRVSVRHNNGFDQLALDASVGAGRRLRWRLGAHGLVKRQGVPGLGSVGAEAKSASLTSGRVLVDATLARSGRAVDLQLAAHVAYERLAYANPRGEQVGTFGPSVVDGESVGGGLSARADVPWGSHQLWSLSAEARLEHRRPYDLLRPSAAGEPSTRGLGALTLADELRFFRDRLALTPALRLDGEATTLAADATGATLPGQQSVDALVSPRLGVRLRVTGWLSLRGSAGRFVRFPTLLERFGDGAFLLARPALQPETAWGGDVGAALALARRWGRLDLETVFFGRRVSDYIAYLPAAFAATAFNVGDTRVLGAELRASARLGSWLAATIDYTLLDAANFSDEPGAYGKQLPGRPRHQLGLRVDLDGAPFHLFYELSYVDLVYRDAQNRNAIPGRALHAIGAAFTRGPIQFTVEVRNLADLRVVDLPLGGTIHQGETRPYPLVDFFDYPLPGRTLYATLAWRPQPVK